MANNLTFLAFSRNKPVLWNPAYGGELQINFRPNLRLGDLLFSSLIMGNSTAERADYWIPTGPNLG